MQILRVWFNIWKENQNEKNTKVKTFTNAKTQNQHKPEEAYNKEDKYVFSDNGSAYEAMSEWFSARVLCEDKTHSTGLTMSDLDILVPKEAWH